MHQDPSLRLRASSVFGERAVVAVVEIDDPADASALAVTLGQAGISALEITVRTEGALDAIQRAAAEDALPVGAGTVLTSEIADAAIDAGATFLVSPAFDASVSTRCAELGVALVPGAITPTEVLRVHSAGHREVKVFPAGSFGGLTLITSLAAVFPDMSFMPTGGVTLENALDYLAHPRVAAVGGTWIAPRDVVTANDWDEISRRAQTIVEARSHQIT